MSILEQDESKTKWSAALAQQFGRVRRFVSDCVARSTLRRQVQALDDRGGLDDFLKDIGSSRPEVERMIRGYGNAERLLPVMMQRLGVDAEALDPATRYEVRRTCATCQTHSRCRRWLAKPGSAKGEYHEFCPSAAIFDAAVGRTNHA